jgi:UDP-GlcNAc:undecaprenyl-phosphate GlcNAc-1-phosphate transferase
MELLLKIFPPFFISALIVLVTTPFVIKTALKFGLIDDPRKHKHPGTIHQKIIPRAGGASLWFAIIFSILIFLPLDKKMVGIILGTTFATLVGLLDDKYDLNPYFRLFSNFLAASFVVGFGVGISFITNPLGGIIRLDQERFAFDFFGRHSILVYADIFALFWIAWVMNMVNWSKGVDGQMPGIAAIASLFLAILALRFYPQDQSQLVVAQLAMVVAGASVGFLFFNFYPAKIFPGYSATNLGYLIAVLAILSQAKVGTALLVMAVPLSDAIFTIVRRLAQGKLPVWADRGHFHHRLLSLGWSQRRIALFYWAVCAILGGISLYLKSIEKVFAIFLVAVILGGAILWINQTVKHKEKEGS